MESPYKNYSGLEFHVRNLGNNWPKGMFSIIREIITGRTEVFYKNLNFKQ